MQSFSIADARSQLPKLVHTAEEGGATQLTRRGKPVAVLISVNEYEALRSQGKGGLLQAFKAYRALMQPAGEDLPDEEVDSWRDKDTGRKLPWE